MELRHRVRTLGDVPLRLPEVRLGHERARLVACIDDVVRARGTPHFVLFSGADEEWSRVFFDLDARTGRREIGVRLAEEQLALPDPRRSWHHLPRLRVLLEDRLLLERVP